MRVQIVQGSSEWETWRRDGIGSSDAPVIAGESPYRSAFDLWAEKTGRAVAEYDEATKRLFRLGHLLEGPLLQYYEQETGLSVERGVVFQHEEFPHLRASLDGLTSRGVVEAKWTTARRWSSENDVPEDVQVQVQHQLHVSGQPVADVVALVRGVPRIVEVKRDESIIADLVKLEQAFWQHVRSGIPPVDWMNGSDAETRALRTMYPQEHRPMEAAPPDVRDLALQLLSAKERRKALEGEIATIENTLRFLVGDREGYEGDEVRIVYRKYKDSVNIGWQQIAEAYRHELEAMDNPPDFVTIEGLYRMTVPGPRVLRVSRSKGAGDE